MKQYCSNRTNVENSGDSPQSLCQKMIHGPVLISVESFHWHSKNEGNGDNVTHAHKHTNTIIILILRQLTLTKTLI